MERQALPEVEERNEAEGGVLCGREGGQFLMSFVTTVVEGGVLVCSSAGNRTEMAPFLLQSLIPSLWKGTQKLHKENVNIRHLFT